VITTDAGRELVFSFTLKCLRKATLRERATGIAISYARYFTEQFS
jgi:hypothetical protein